MDYLLTLVLMNILQGVKAPLPNYLPAAEGNIPQNDLITSYFHQQYSNNEILLFLAVVHGIHMSLRTLERILNSLNLRRRVDVSDDLLRVAISEISKELESSGQCLGYKAMWRRLHNRGIKIPRETVRLLILELDPQSVHERSRKRLKRRVYVSPGPNFVWHIDGYDKLKPFGFSIHGAIDGFSRKVLWLEVGISNNNPKIVAKYFLDTIMQMKVLPRVVRCDCGTENVHIKDIQVHFRSDGTDEFSGQNSYMEGKSINNQRIEAWWAILRKQCTNYWMNLFKDMVSCGLYDSSNPTHVHSLRFCFLELIEDDLKRIAKEWNQHNILAKKNAETPRGKPDIMYFAPEAYDTNSFGVPFAQEDAMSILNELDVNDCIPDNNDPDFVQLVNIILPNWELPNNVDAALQLYAKIVDSISRADV